MEGLCLEEGRGRGMVRDVVRSVCERVAEGGGGGCCDRSQVSGYDLRSQRLTLTLLTQGYLYLGQRDKSQYSPFVQNKHIMTPD